jgi:hypothetical protein
LGLFKILGFLSNPEKQTGSLQVMAVLSPKRGPKRVFLAVKLKLNLLSIFGGLNSPIHMRQQNEAASMKRGSLQKRGSLPKAAVFPDPQTWESGNQISVEWGIKSGKKSSC